MQKSSSSTSSSDVFVRSERSDLTIRCGLDEYKLHRAILSEHSGFFARVCDGNAEVRKRLPKRRVLMPDASLAFRLDLRGDPLLILFTGKHRRPR